MAYRMKVVFDIAQTGRLYVGHMVSGQFASITTRDPGHLSSVPAP
jgi:hypothetical protein